MTWRGIAFLVSPAVAAAGLLVAGAPAEHGLKKQRTWANLIGPGVASPHSLVTWHGQIGNVSSGAVVIQSRPKESRTWTTVARVPLKSDGTFVFRTRAGRGPVGAETSRASYYRVVFAGDATHLPSSQDCFLVVV
jgi:hypothetical protein